MSFTPRQLPAHTHLQGLWEIQAAWNQSLERLLANNVCERTGVSRLL